MPESITKVILYTLIYIISMFYFVYAPMIGFSISSAVEQPMIYAVVSMIAAIATFHYLKLIVGVTKTLFTRQKLLILLVYWRTFINSLSGSWNLFPIPNFDMDINTDDEEETPPQHKVSTLIKRCDTTPHLIDFNDE